MIRKLALALAAGCFCFLAIGEFVVRASFPLLRAQSPGYYYRQYFDALFVPDAKLIWRGKPSAVAAISNTAGQEISYAFNTEGWRAAELKAGPKILLLGDSFTFGTGVGAEERYGDRLAEQLPGLQTYPAALMGYSVDQYYLLARDLLPKEKWSALVVQLSNNDLSDISDHNWLGTSLPEAITWRGDSGASRSELWGLLKYLGVIVKKSQRTPAEVSANLARYRLALEGLVAEAKKNRVPLIFLRATDWGEPVYGKKLAGEYEQTVKEIAERHKIPLVEAQAAMKDLLPFPDLHWNAGGHEVVARMLLPSLKAKMAGK